MLKSQTIRLHVAAMLVLSLLVGLVIGMFQAMTQINEATLTFVPKIIAVVIAARDVPCANVRFIRHVLSDPGLASLVPALGFSLDPIDRSYHGSRVMMHCDEPGPHHFGDGAVRVFGAVIAA